MFWSNDKNHFSEWRILSWCPSVASNMQFRDTPTLGSFKNYQIAMSHWNMSCSVCLLGSFDKTWHKSHKKTLSLYGLQLALDFWELLYWLPVNEMSFTSFIFLGKMLCVIKIDQETGLCWTHTVEKEMKSIHIKDKCAYIKDHLGQKFRLKPTETDRNRQKRTEI